MPKITLPDGSVKEFEGSVTALDVAESIGSRLAKAAVGAKVDGALCDLSTPIDRDCELSIVTEKTRAGETDPDALYLLRHSAAHVMAEAIQRVVPGAELVYGPPLETGFYYDIAFPEDRPLREGDFEAIEKEMAAIVKEDRPFTRYELPRAVGFAKLRPEGSKYKLDNAQRAVAAGADRLSWYVTGKPTASVVDEDECFAVRLGEDDAGDPIFVRGTPRRMPDGRREYELPVLTSLQEGDFTYGNFEGQRLHDGDFEDLCRGPHAPSTDRIPAFRLLRTAGAYWRNNRAQYR